MAFKDTGPDQLAERLEYGATQWKTAWQLPVKLHTTSCVTRRLNYQVFILEVGTLTLTHKSVRDCPHQGYL